MRHTAAKLFAALAITTSLATVAAGQASADPSILPTLPAAKDIVGVGSDTTQSVLNQFSADYNTFLGTGSTLPHLYSWDATGSATIANTKTGSATNIPARTAPAPASPRWPPPTPTPRWTSPVPRRARPARRPA